MWLTKTPYAMFPSIESARRSARGRLTSASSAVNISERAKRDQERGVNFASAVVSPPQQEQRRPEAERPRGTIRKARPSTNAIR
jgi:hypothetical protein